MQDIIIYKNDDGKASVPIFAKDGIVWMNQNQLAELFDTSVPNINMHISNIQKEGELVQVSVILVAFPKLSLSLTNVKPVIWKQKKIK